jgi:hypothetical protein
LNKSSQIAYSIGVRCPSSDRNCSLPLSDVWLAKRECEEPCCLFGCAVNNKGLLFRIR